MTRDLLDDLLWATDSTDPVWQRLDVVVRRAAEAVGHSGNPPSADGRRWTPDRLEDLVQEFWATGSADKVILASSDDQHLRALVVVVVRNLAIGELRKSGRAALHDRLVDVLAQGEFVKAGAYWRLPGQASDVTYQGSRHDLLDAAFAVPVTRLYVKETSKRESSFATRAQIEDLLRAVLERAGAAVSLADLKDIAHRWLNLHPPYIAVTIKDTFSSSDEAVGVAAEVENAVGRIWVRIGADGQELLLFMDPNKNTSRDTAAVVVYGHDKVARVIKATKEILREELQDLPRDEQLAILRHLKDRQRRRLLAQTDQADGALNEGGDP
jgi:hypothetical protein